MNEALALENLHQRLQLQIAARRHDVFSGPAPPLVVLPILLVGLRPVERVADHVFDAHPRRRIAQRSVALAAAGAAARTLRVLAQRELDARHRAFEGKVFGPALAPAQLDHVVLAANRVGAAVKDVRGGEAAGEVAVDVDVGRIKDVLDAGHRAHRRAHFVD